MATSVYGIRECRIVMRQTEFDVFVLIDNPNDFLPIGGWYVKTVTPPDGTAYFEDAVRELEQALHTQAYLKNDGWYRGAPSEATEWQQQEIERVRNANMELTMEVARLRLGVTSVPQ